MNQTIDPKTFGLHPATRIEKTGDTRYTLVIKRKSRLVMKDGHTLLSKAERIRSQIDGATIDVRTTAPVCSKTRAFLKEQGIGIITETP
ncbi:MAG: hypothetical protein ABIK68_05775 [bacterium]|nr:hypothetical protein [bacterium]